MWIKSPHIDGDKAHDQNNRRTKATKILAMRLNPDILGGGCYQMSKSAGEMTAKSSLSIELQFNLANISFNGMEF